MFDETTVADCFDDVSTNKVIDSLDHEVAQLTKLRSAPNERLGKVGPGRRNQPPVSTVKMLAGREGNFSGRGRFSSADCCHVLGRYLPGSHIRIYNVEQEWKVQKSIHAKSMRWTVTDTSLSPDQRHLVYASMSPIVHIVNVGSAETESFANVTEIHEGLGFSSADGGGYPFGIFSIKFSTDGREVVAGSSDDSIYVYDLESNKLSL